MTERKQTYAYGKNYKPCPYAKIKRDRTNGGRYDGWSDHSAQCCSGKYVVEIRDDTQTAICMGRTLGGKNFRSCDRYKPMNKLSESEKQRVQRKRGKKQVKDKITFADILKWTFITIFVLACLKGITAGL